MLGEKCALVDVRLAIDASEAMRTDTRVRVLAVDAIAAVQTRLASAVVVAIYNTTECLKQAIRVRCAVDGVHRYVTVYAFALGVVPDDAVVESLGSGCVTGANALAVREVI